MRLWHEDLIPYLPAGQLLGQHRECCALRGNGWARKHSVVDYVFSYPPHRLFLYHRLVMDEMEARGYRVSPEWRDPLYRGKSCAPHADALTGADASGSPIHRPIYPDHDEDYLNECLYNLRQKGIEIKHFDLK